MSWISARPSLAICLSSSVAHRVVDAGRSMSMTSVYAVGGADPVDPAGVQHLARGSAPALEPGDRRPSWVSSAELAGDVDLPVAHRVGEVGGQLGALPARPRAPSAARPRACSGTPGVSRRSRWSSATSGSARRCRRSLSMAWTPEQVEAVRTSPMPRTSRAPTRESSRATTLVADTRIRENAWQPSQEIRRPLTCVARQTNRSRGGARPTDSGATRDLKATQIRSAVIHRATVLKLLFC